MRHILSFIIAFGISEFAAATQAAEKVPAYKNPKISIGERVSDLISRMSLEEKISQISRDAPAIERLDIPKYNWWNECLNGVKRAGSAPVFPQAVGMAPSAHADDFALAIVNRMKVRGNGRHGT